MSSTLPSGVAGAVSTARCKPGTENRADSPLWTPLKRQQAASGPAGHDDVARSRVGIDILFASVSLRAIIPSFSANTPADAEWLELAGGPAELRRVVAWLRRLLDQPALLEDLDAEG